MRNKPLLFFVAPLLISAGAVLADTGYSTADVLVIRAKPSRNAQILGAIPFGTSIAYLPERTKADGLEWVFSTSAGGYLALSYLSAQQPSANKSMVLRVETSFMTCHGDGGWGKGHLRLARGTFQFAAQVRPTSVPSEDIQASGTYTVVSGALVLTALKITRNKHITSEAPVKLALHYVPALDGFVLHEEPPPRFLVLVLPSDNRLPDGTVVDRKACAVVKREACPEGPAKEYSSISGFLCL